MSHDWQRQFFPAPVDKWGHVKIDPQTGEQREPTETWVTCERCRTQACQAGYGSKAKAFYRETSEHEWTHVEPLCVDGLRTENERLRAAIIAAMPELNAAHERLEGESVRSIVAERASDDVDAARCHLALALEPRPSDV